MFDFGQSKRRTHSPGVVEDALLGCAGVTDIAAFSLDQSDGTDIPWVAIVRGQNYQQTVLALRFKERFPDLPPLRFANVDTIQRNGMGKIK